MDLPPVVSGQLTMDSAPLAAIHCALSGNLRRYSAGSRITTGWPVRTASQAAVCSSRRTPRPNLATTGSG